VLSLLCVVAALCKLDWAIPVTCYSGHDEDVGGEIREKDECADESYGIRFFFPVRGFFSERFCPDRPNFVSQSFLYFPHFPTGHSISENFVLIFMMHPHSSHFPSLNFSQAPQRAKR
jgi:hypothetical protein